jgi:HSP20 family protein
MPERWRFQNPESFRPVRELEEIGRRLQDEVVRPVMRAVWERVPEQVKGWSPAVDVIEREDTFEVKVELPGIKQADIDLSVSDNTLTVRGERTPADGAKDEDYYRNEIAYGSFYREITLPSKVDVKNVEAVYEDGILSISLQRAAGAKPKKVSVQVKKGTN